MLELQLTVRSRTYGDMSVLLASLATRVGNGVPVGKLDSQHGNIEYAIEVIDNDNPHKVSMFNHQKLNNDNPAIPNMLFKMIAMHGDKEDIKFVMHHYAMDPRQLDFLINRLDDLSKNSNDGNKK